MTYNNKKERKKEQQKTGFSRFFFLKYIETTKQKKRGNTNQ